jgi:RNA polymerase sigma-70 factor, ECF subfamily
MSDCDSKADVTLLLKRVSHGDEAAQRELFPVLYTELRALARKSMRSERQDHTLQPTALVHEAFLRLTAGNPIAWQNRAHFLVAAARTMRHVLIDHARSVQAQKRQGGERIDFRPDLLFTDGKAMELVALEEALARLESLAPRQCRIVELKYFAGMDTEQIASVLAISPRTIKREWQFARAWLHAQLSG